MLGIKQTALVLLIAGNTYQLTEQPNGYQSSDGVYYTKQSDGNLSGSDGTTLYENEGNYQQSTGEQWQQQDWGYQNGGDAYYLNSINKEE